MTGSHIVVAGCGNTGSHLLPHLARIRAIGRITLVDPDIYDDTGNLYVQNIDRADIGRSKVCVQAEKLDRIRCELELIALQSRIEDVPRGQLRADIIAACVDSRSARQHVNELAWRLDTRWIDCGVRGSEDLARVTVYHPGPAAPCIECAWGPEDYDVLEQEYACGDGAQAHPTMGSSALGALAGALMAVEINGLLRGSGSELTGRQWTIDARRHGSCTTSFRRNPSCRFDHRAWPLEPCCCTLDTFSVGDALAAWGALRVEGHRFASDLVCPACGVSNPGLRLNRPLARCHRCRRRMVASGLGFFDSLDSGSAGSFAHLSLAQIGLLPGDIVTGAESRHLLLEAA